MASDPEAGLRRLAMFRAAAQERLTRLNLGWIRLEQGAGGADAAAELLRELHTLKGEAALMGFGAVASVVHAVEDVVRHATRSEKPDAATGDLLLGGLDVVAVLIARAPDAPAPEAEAYVASAAPYVAGVSGPAARATVTAAASSPPVAVRQDVVRTTPQRLDRLRDMVGELLLTHSRVAASAADLRRARGVAEESRRAAVEADPVAARAWTIVLDTLGGAEARVRDDAHQLSRLVHELDAATRELRMVPIGVLFEQYPAAVRSLARDLGRDVHLEVAGDSVEVDRAVLERIAEPLLHLVTNAVDHGIEPPEDRRRARKGVAGTIRVSARLAGHGLEVTVEDDGAGIDVESVRDRAVELGVLPASTAAQASDDEVLGCLFAAGMSTRRQVTRLSGRGVGLSVVLAGIEELGGRVTIASRRGAGTTFRLSVPITVAITSVLLFRVGWGRYALPSVVVESILDGATTAIVEGVHGNVIRQGDAWVPVVGLAALLGESGGPTGGVPSRLVIVRSAGARVALAGPRELAEHEAIIKSSGHLFDRQPLVGGAVPLPDGTVALVLKVAELVAAGRAGGRDAAIRAAGPAGATHGRTVLVVDDSPVVRDLVAEALRAHGLRIVEAADGEEALARLDAFPDIGLVVTDIEMPRLDGIGLIRSLRARAGARIPAVVVSMRGSDEDKRRAMQVGADAYLVKSDLSHAGLWTMLARFLGDT